MTISRIVLSGGENVNHVGYIAGTIERGKWIHNLNKRERERS